MMTDMESNEKTEDLKAVISTTDAATEQKSHESADIRQDMTNDKIEGKERKEVQRDVVQLNGDEDGYNGSPSLRRDRPFSASMISRRSGVSTRSRASLSPTMQTTDLASKSLFSYRDGAFEKAVTDCKQSIAKSSVDGEVKGSWLLTEIDHWDIEREKLVLLTDNTLIVVKYDFIKMVPYDVKCMKLDCIEELKIGDLIYPNTSVMPQRDHGGVRIIFSKNNASFSQRWNPWCRSMPYITFTHHLLIYNKRESDTVLFNVDDFVESLVQAVNQVHQRAQNESDRKMISITEGPITIESYASITSVIFNQSKIGFNLERGGVSF